MYPCANRIASTLHCISSAHRITHFQECTRPLIILMSPIGGKGVLPPLSITSQPSNLSHQSLEYCVFGQSHLECQESSGRTVVECVCGRSCQRGCRQKQLFSLKCARRSREEGGWKDAAHRGRGVGETGSRGHGELLVACPTPALPCTSVLCMFDRGSRKRLGSSRRDVKGTLATWGKARFALLCIVSV